MPNEPTSRQFAWRTDEASGDIDAIDADDVVAQLVAEQFWAAPGDEENKRIANGGWLVVLDRCEVVLERGEVW